MKKWLLTLAALAVALTLLVALSAQMRRATAAEHSLRESTLLALSEASESLQAAALAMDKLRVTTDPHQSQTQTHLVAQHANLARHALASLPDNKQALPPVLAWLTRLASLAEDDLAAHAAGQAVSTDDLLRMQNDLHRLHAELDLARQSLLSGEALSSSLPPTTITDAPTAVELTTYRGLPATEFGSGAALQIAKEFVGVERVVSVAHAPDTTGALPAFGVTVQTPDVQLNVEVTARGGKVLLMVPETANFPVRKTVEDARRAASTFLESRGFASMEATYYQQYDGLCVLTFVHIQNDALIWADRVLVQVRMDTAEVVGLEARSYWKNHTPRKIAAPLLTEREASALLSPTVQVQESRLCLLPYEKQERLCWQFTLTQNDETYVTYIDAITGQELLIEKVMQLEFGSIAA